jgi:hypothetical protein
MSLEPACDGGVVIEWYGAPCSIDTSATSLLNEQLIAARVFNSQGIRRLAKAGLWRGTG